MRIQNQRTGWAATVWRWEPHAPLSARRELASTTSLATALEATMWAGDVMVADGAIVMVLDAPRNLLFASLLDFSLAPEPV